MAENLPAYLTSTQPVPAEGRAPWYKNTAQTYAGIFLWIAFYDQLAGTGTGGPGTLGMAGLGMCLLALVAAGLLSHALFYVVPGMLGMKTGLPLYIVGTSTFGTKGGYFLPGIFMGLLQIGWYSVATYFAADLVLKGVGMGEHSVSIFGAGGKFDIIFVIMAVVWGYLFAFLGGLGIGMVAKMSTYFPVIPIVMLLAVGVMSLKHVGNYDREAATKNSLAAVTILDEAAKAAENAAKLAGESEAEAKQAGADARAELAKKPAEQARIDDTPLAEPQQDIVQGTLKMAGFLLMIQLVIGFFATAGACGADFCSNNRDKKDVRMGGLVGVALATLFAGGLAVLGVAAAQGALTANIGAAENGTTWGQLSNYTLSGSLQSIVPVGDKLMLILFAIGSVAPACFCSFIIGNSLSTMLAKPQARVGITMAGATIGIILAATGLAGNLAPFFGLIGASFGPVIGAMIADYLLSGKKWAGPRAGISIPGYAAWLIGFLVGISNNDLVNKLLDRMLEGDGHQILAGWHPTGVYSLIVGFIIYAILAKMGLEAKTVELPAANAPAEG
jgi:cytosine permease